MAGLPHALFVARHLGPITRGVGLGDAFDAAAWETFWWGTVVVCAVGRVRASKPARTRAKPYPSPTRVVSL